MPARLPLTLLLAALPLVLPAAASAQRDFQRIFNDYKADGRLDGCYKPGQLNNAGRQIPPDIEQYAPGFGEALTAAHTCGARQRAAERHTREEQQTAAAPKPKPKQGVKPPPAPEPPAEPLLSKLPPPTLEPAEGVLSSDPPGALVVLAIAAGAALLAGLAWLVAWLTGWSPERFTRPVAAGFGELGGRLSDRVGALFDRLTRRR